ncbi:MAG: OmpA/MotB family protein [Planctomycetota bacterium]|jgi:chemotaxis protein MotB
MQDVNKKTVTLLICLAAFTLLSGCIDWKKRYKSLDVAYRNLEGRLEYEMVQKSQLAEEVGRGQQTIAELQRKIAAGQTAAQASAFGEGYDVSFDAAAGTITVTLPNTILFGSGRAVLKKTTITELDHIYFVLQKKYGSKQIDVLGHTDTDPIKKSKWKDNWELSSERALAVVRYLLGKGIAKEKIRAVGCGAARPVVSNETVSGKAKNRRVEIVVHVK